MTWEPPDTLPEEWLAPFESDWPESAAGPEYWMWKHEADREP